MKKKASGVFSLFIAVLTILSATACGAQSSGEGILRVALQTTAQGVPAYAAEVGGVVDVMGIQVESAVYASGPAQNEALGANEWDVATMGAPPAIMAAIAYDAKIIAFSCMESSTEFFVRPDSDIAAVEGAVEGFPKIKGNAETWRGKTILCPLTTTSHFILLTVLEKMGLTQNDINLINMDVGQAYTAFKSGQGDVLTLWDPLSFTGEEEGWISVVYGPDTDAACPCVLVASAKAIEEKPEEIKAWLKAYFAVVESSAFDDQQMADMTYELFNDNNMDITREESMLFAQRKEFPDIDEAYRLFFGEDGTSPAEQYMETIVEFFYSQGSLSQEDVDKIANGELFETGFIQELYEETRD